MPIKGPIWALLRNVSDLYDPITYSLRTRAQFLSIAFLTRWFITKRIENFYESIPVLRKSQVDLGIIFCYKKRSFLSFLWGNSLMVAFLFLFDLIEEFI